jgi:hypothetical protein
VALPPTTLLRAVTYVFSLLSGTEFEARLAPSHVGMTGLYAYSAEKQHRKNIAILFGLGFTFGMNRQKE